MEFLLIVATFGLLLSVCAHGIMSEVNFQKKRSAFSFKPFWE